LQDSEPRKKPPLTPKELKTGFKEPDSESWTPVRIIVLPPSVIQKLGSFSSINKHRVMGKNEEFEILDEKYGRDIFISYNKDAAGSAKYDVQLGDVTPLTREEKKYLTYDLASVYKPESVEQAEREAKLLDAKASPDPSIDTEDDDDDAISKIRRKSGSKGSGDGTTSRRSSRDVRKKRRSGI
jgi:hypothetical protein